MNTNKTSKTFETPTYAHVVYQVEEIDGRRFYTRIGRAYVSTNGNALTLRLVKGVPEGATIEVRPAQPGD